MIERLTLLLGGLLLMASTAMADKAGVGAWENSGNRTLEWIEDTPGLDWYYNWRPDQLWHQGRQRRSVEFVPMIHSAADLRKPVKSSKRVKALLGFNEPDGRGSHQAGLSPQKAAQLWPQLEKRGLRLGSPATTQGQTLGRNSWQGKFMREVAARGLRVDFMAVHYYSTNGDVKAFEAWLRKVHATYKRPIWVTEFARIDWDRPNAVTYEQNARFAEDAIQMMERLPFVERHAWFAANPYPWGGTVPEINLVTDTLAPTPTGKAFDRTLSRLAGRPVAANGGQASARAGKK